MGAVFPEVDALPSAKNHGTPGDRYADVDVGQRGADVGRHVVVPLVVVLVNRIGIWGQAGEDRFKVGADAWVGVFLNQQRSRCVTNM